MFVIREIGDSEEEYKKYTKYETKDKAMEFAITNLNSYENGFEIVNKENNEVVYRDKRKKVSRIELIDWD